MRLPRSKVALITLGPGALTNRAPLPFGTNTAPRAVSTGITNADPELSATLSQLGAHTNLIQQVQKQFLSGAGPEANDKFNELLGGLMTGKLSVDDIRAQAKTAADQLRSLKGDLGEDAGFAVDGYLAILDHFLKESAPPGSGTTNAPAALSKPKSETAEEDK